MTALLETLPTMSSYRPNEDQTVTNAIRAHNPAILNQIASIEIKPGTGPEFEAALAALSAKVKAHEPDTLVYSFYRVNGSDTSYRVFESYASKAAANHHMRNPETKSEMRALWQFMVAPPSIEVWEECAA